jgi:F-type H+-transporting ATPase subunit epsilon
MKTMQVDVVSAEELIYSGEATFVALPGEVGELGIYPRHTPLISRIKAGSVRIHKPDGEQEFVFVAGGILEVQPDSVTVLSDTAVRGADLDEERANAAKASGHASWKAMQREAAAHAKWGTDPLPPPEPHACGEAPTTSQCGVCEPDGDGGARAPPPPPAGFDAAAAMRAGFVNSQETTHGLTTAQLRERLAAAGVGVRMATAGDFGLW